MTIRVLASLALAACSGGSASEGKVVVMLTVDWEGAYVAPEGIAAMTALRADLDAPVTHFISAGYFSKPSAPQARDAINAAVRSGDEVAVHLHAWQSLAVASDVKPKLSPSYLSGTDEIIELDDGEVGFDTDLDVYSVPELRALLRTSRRLLEQTGQRVSQSFRAGGYLTTPKVLQAIHDEGFTVDSSAVDYRQLEKHLKVLPERLHALWPDIDPTSQPRLQPAFGGELIELPIATIADYATTEATTAVLDQAALRLQQDPTRDVFVVLAWHQETAGDYAERIAAAMAKAKSSEALRGNLMFSTVEAAAQRAAASIAR